ncbi:hypothetical protein TSOC_011379, partial [Tetrabaena socialis]
MVDSSETRASHNVFTPAAQATQALVGAAEPSTVTGLMQLPASLEAITSHVTAAGDVKEQLRRLLELGKGLAALPQTERTAATRVMGCSSEVWISAQLDGAGRLHFQGWSESEISRGLVALVVTGLSGCTADQVFEVPSAQLQQQLAAVLGPAGLLAPGRTAGVANILEAAKRQARALAAPQTMELFPSLMIRADSLEPQGAFAEAQAAYLRPDQHTVTRLAEVLRRKQIGVVAHFYMDPEVQGVLSSAAELWPHIAISDSLVMADTAVRMAEAGCKSVCVLGVDFMSENVRAILDEAGHAHVQVYRMAAADIGCSLAEAAESDALHVVYINTSLRTKALAHDLVPTITCTSSNVVQTILTAFA